MSTATPPPGLYPSQPPYPVPPPVKPKREKKFGWLPLILTGVIGLGVGGAIGGAGDGNTTAAPAPTTTRTVTAPPVEGGSEPTEAPEPEPTKAPAAFDPQPKEFQVGVKVLKKECFGSAGCNVSFRIVPKYTGKAAFPSEGSTEVTYEVRGGEDPVINTFTVEADGTVTYSEEESASTTSSSKKLTAKATEVEYSEFG